MAKKDPVARAQYYLDLYEKRGEKIPPELALMLGQLDTEIKAAEFFWLKDFPFADSMSQEDWYRLWQKIRPIIHAHWEKFHGPGKQAR